MLFLTYFTIVIIVIILAILIFKAIELYLNYKKDIQNREHYPIVLGITLASIPILAKLSSFDNILIQLINRYTSFSLPLPKNDLMELSFYFFFVALIAFLGFLIYKSLYGNDVDSKEVNTDKTITFPEEIPAISPYLYIRIKELFELKYEKNDLVLSYDEKEQVLHGSYSEQFHSYQFLIYCDDNEKNVSIEEKETILKKLKELNKVDPTVDTLYFYFIKDGSFNENNSELKCFTENEFIDSIIPFSKYLKKNISSFENEEIDIGGKALKDTFITPSYNNGKNDLEGYIDNWLEEKSHRHLVLLADYGMGKTSFLKYYTKYLSEKILNGKRFIRYPVFISLTNTSPMSNDGIETKIESFVANELGVNYALFQRLIHLGKIVFILDGFDEMGFIGTETTRFEQFNSIWKLATNNNKILISGRPSYLPTNFERKNVLNIVDKELYDTQVTPFTEVIQLDYFDSKKIYQTVNLYYSKKESLKYINYIKKNKSIYDLCKRPSMLHMTMFILPNIYNTNKQEIITSSMIMTKYIEYWISRQDSKQVFGIYKHQDDKKKKFIIDFFTDLSIYMFENQTLLVEKNDLDTLVINKIKKDKLGIEKNTNELEGFINEICTGYFIEIDINNEDSFKFVHKSIFEFFVSIKIIQLIKNHDFSHEIFSQDWGTEISDFVQDSIKIDKNNKYPALINLRDDFLDRYFFVPITKFVSKKRILGLLLVSYLILVLIAIYSKSKGIEHEKNIIFNWKEFLLALIVVISIKYILTWKRKRLRFISRAYYIDFISGHNKISHSQWQYFLDFNKYFKEISNIKMQNILFKNLDMQNISINNVELNNVTFEKCSLRINFQNSLLSQINFIKTKIKYLTLENVDLFDITLERCSFHKLNKYDYFEAKLLDKIYYIHAIPVKTILNDSIKFTYRYLLKKYRSRIILKNVTMDDNSIKEFQKFIQENKIRRKDISCDNLELKDKLFNSDQ